MIACSCDSNLIVVEVVATSSRNKKKKNSMIRINLVDHYYYDWVPVLFNKSKIKREHIKFQNS